jgi:hypothetical protein
MTDDRQDRPAPLPSGPRDLRAGTYGGALPPAAPDVGKRRALSYYDRHPEHRPPRRPWHRSIRRKLMESA